MDRNAPSSRVFLLALLLSAALAIVLAPAARADTIYSYTGQSLGNFVPPLSCLVGASCPITGSFSVLQAIPANGCLGQGVPGCAFFPPGDLVSWSFTDGLTTWTNANSFAPSFTLSTGPNGGVASWSIFFQQPQPNGDCLYMSTISSMGFANDVSGNLIQSSGCANLGTSLVIYGSNTSQPGIWSVTTNTAPIPEPASILLLATGLLGAAGFARRRWLE